ncbi:MAG: hypothetical protein WD772_08010 [Pseudohongiellaceae bacterium]
MDIVFTSLAALGLLVLLVIALHRHQLSAAQSLVDRNLPLPPIGLQIGQRRTSITPVQSEPPAVEPAVAESVVTGNPTSTKGQAPRKSAQANWLTQVAELKKAGRRADALTLCLKALPLWSAFQQASLLLRANIKAIQAANQPIEEDLKKLYQLTAVAALLHDRSKGLSSLTSAQLKRLDLTEILSLPMPYNEIGYLQLQLIKKSDIRVLLDTWGKPAAHLSPRQFHQSLWQSLVAGPGQDIPSGS